MIDVDYNEYKETIAQNMKLVVENHDLKQEIERLTAESTKWESKYYEEAKKVDKAIDKLNNMKDTYYESNMANDMQNIFDLLDILKGVDKE